MKPKIGTTPGFTLDEEQNSLTNPKRKKLVPLEPIKTEEQIKKEREEEAKQIIAMIPASKEDLFSFQLDWAIIDEVRPCKDVRFRACVDTPNPKALPLGTGGDHSQEDEAVDHEEDR